MQHPKLNELTIAVSAFIYAQIERDQNFMMEGRTNAFNMFNEDQVIGAKYQPSEVSPSSICRFIRSVFDVGQFHAECCIIMLIYLNRTLASTQIPLTTLNWKPLVVTCLVIAQKVWDDTPLINSDFSLLYPHITVHKVNELERVILNLLEFKLTISPSLYARYFFECHNIMEEINNRFGRGSILRDCGGSLADRHYVPRVHMSEIYSKHKKDFKKRINTPEYLCYDEPYPVIS